MKRYYILIDADYENDYVEITVYESEKEARKWQDYLWGHRGLNDYKDETSEFDLGYVDYSDERWEKAINGENGSQYDEDEENEERRAKEIALVEGFDKTLKTIEDLRREDFEKDYDEDYEVESFINGNYFQKFVRVNLKIRLGKDILKNKDEWNKEEEELEDYLDTSTEKIKKIKEYIKEGRWEEKKLKREGYKYYNQDENVTDKIAEELKNE